MVRAFLYSIRILYDLDLSIPFTYTIVTSFAIVLLITTVSFKYNRVFSGAPSLVSLRRFLFLIGTYSVSSLTTIS